MIAVSTWVWALVGIAAFVAVGVLVALLLGAAGTPGDPARRAWHRFSFRRQGAYRGQVLPPEVPERAERSDPE